MENGIADGFKGEKAIVTPYSIREYQAGNDICKQLYITHIGYYPQAENHYRKREFGTEEHIFIYCERGQGWIEWNDEHFLLEENSFFIVPPHTQHAYGADAKKPWSIYWFHFKGNNTHQFQSIIGKLITLNQSDNSRRDDRIRMFDEMYQNLSMGYNPENLEYISFCLRHFLASLKYVTQYREIRKVEAYDVIQQAIRYMKDHLEDKISLNDLARVAGYSSTHFGVLFMQRTSFSPMEYYNQLKIQRACSYLQFSDLTIKEIAFRLNYYDPFHFSNAFRKEMEISPREYRQRYRDYKQEAQAF